ncbi:MAG: bifunctional hydroxymethylpyrimidine kinase/phosphomethylpyrimidine kinase [Nitrososphaerales archaeon]
MTARALTIAGSDPSSGAGIQADLKTFSLLGVYGTSVITAVTAQNTKGITRITPLEPAAVRAQISAVLNDITVGAIKVGMVHSNEIIGTVAGTLRGVKVPVILDPVFRAGTGAPLLRNDAYRTFVKRLVPLATVITPNIPEAERLAGMRIRNVDDATAAARRIAELGADTVIVKGGHMRGAYSIDILYRGKGFVELREEKIRTGTLHGAGSIFSAAIAAEMAKGRNVVDAARIANQFTRRAIMNARKVGKGLRIPSLDRRPPASRLLATLQYAVEKLQAIENMGMLVPESQSNLVFAKPDARSVEDIAAVSGRMVKLNDGRVATADGVDLGASRHVASAVLAMMQHDKTIRSAMNIKYSERIVKTCREIGLKVSSYDRRSEPQHIKEKEGASVRWGIDQAIAATGAGGNDSKMPDVVYHLGDWGKEPMILVFGREPLEVARRIVSILHKYAGQ